jgi:S-layer homology domain.
MKKRILSLLLAALLLLSLLPAASLPAWAEGEIVAEGIWCSTLEWSLDEEGWLYLFTPDCDDMPLGEWNEESGHYEMPWYPYREQINTVQLANIAAVCEDAFYGCTHLETVLIYGDPDTIHPTAFADCPLQDFYCSFDLATLDWILDNSGIEELGAERMHYLGWNSISDHWTERDTAPTCTSDGVVGLSCPCGYVLGEITPALGHDFVDGVCTRCGARDYELTGDCGAQGGNLVWRLDPNTGVMRITGVGEMMSAEENNASYGSTPALIMPWAPYIDLIETLIVEPGVTGIGDHAFSSCEELSSVCLADSVQSIGESAFRSCKHLSSVELSEGLRTLGSSAFQNCEALRSLTLPQGVTELPDFVFAWSGLRSLEIPAGVTEISGLAFCSCADLSSFSVHPDNPVFWVGSDGILYATRSGKTTLVRCPLAKSGIGAFVVPADVSALAECAFEECLSLTAVTIPEGITEIPYCAFDDCINLRSVTLPDSLLRIGVAAFDGCEKLRAVSLPDGLTEIMAGAFSNCTSLSSIRIPGSVTEIGYMAFYDDTGLCSFIAEEGLETLGSSNFSHCTSLTTVVLPASLSHMGINCFYECPIEDLYFGGSSTAWAALRPANAEVNAQRIHFGVTDPENHWTEVSRAPSCTAVGYTALACTCGYLAQYRELPTLGHDFVEGVCTRCGQINYEADGTELPFGDVPETAYYAEAVAWALNNGIAAGTSEDSFSPDEACSRAQLMTFLWRAAGCPEPVSQDCPFTDVPADAYYTKAVLWAVERGITSGTTDTTFSPKQVCTRAQTVTFLWRAEGSPAPASGDLPFTDLVSGAYYYQAVKWTTQQGIVSGVSETSFAPNQACTRGQAVTLLYRYYHMT